MVRRGPDYRQPCGKIDSGIERQRLERYQPLIVIHCQHGIELILHVDAEKTIRRIWAESKYPLPVRTFYGRSYDIHLFIPQKPPVARMRIQAEHRQLGLHDIEILYKSP